MGIVGRVDAVLGCQLICVDFRSVESIHGRELSRGEDRLVFRSDVQEIVAVLVLLFDTSAAYLLLDTISSEKTARGVFYFSIQVGSLPLE